MIRKLQTNFTNGAVSAPIRARYDNPAYLNSAETIENCTILPQGGLTRRPGLFAIGTLAYSDAQIEEFIFSTTQAYVFLLAAGRLDIYDKNTRTFVMSLTGLPWTASHIANVECCCNQALDTMLISHPDFETVVIKRYGAADFRRETIQWSPDRFGQGMQPYHKYAPAASVLVLSTQAAGSGNIVYCSHAWFQAAHTSRTIRFKGYVLFINSVISPTQLSCSLAEAIPNIQPGNLPNLGPDPEWDEEAFPNTGLRGFIRCTAFHEQRLVIGGGRDVPNTLWLSQSGLPFNMDTGTGLDSDAIKATIFADRVVEIKALVSMGNLQVFCGHGEFIVPWGGQNATTPANFSIKQQSGYGIKGSRARRFDQASIFITRVANTIREFWINQGAWIESYSADSVSIMAQDLIRNPKSLDTQMEGVGSQQAICYVTNSDGTLAVLTKVKKENIGGWLLWTTQGTVNRAGVIDRELWVLTTRTIGGSPVNTLEVLDTTARLDFCQTRTFGSPTSHVGPFPLHLGQTVHALSGDLYFGTFTVDPSGYIDLPIAVSSATVGLNFVPRVVPLHQEVDLPDGKSYGLPKRYVRSIADLQDTGSIKLGRRLLNSSTTESDPSAATPLVTGQFEAWHLGWRNQPRVEITSPLPLPFTLRALMTEVEV